MYAGSDNGYPDVYMVPNMGSTAQAGNLTNEAGPEFIYDQGFYYPAASYYGYYGAEMQSEWSDQQQFFGLDGQNLHYSAWQTENSPYAYYPPNYGYAQPSYNPYNPYIPGAIVGLDSQIAGSQQYQIVQSNSDHALSAYDAGMSFSGRQSMGSKYSQANVSNGRTPYNDSLAGSVAQSVQDPRVSSSTILNFESNTHGWKTNDRFNPRIHLNGATNTVISNSEILNEQNRGPRTNRSKGQSSLATTSAVLNGTNCESNVHEAIIIHAADYNKTNFPTDYPDAKFYVIKSYSEDDVHKSIKYNVWSSTPNGNTRLNNAYLDAQKIHEEKQGRCPIFLFFSVNASGLFCGAAEMVGPVDFDKSMDFWQLDKWNGSFPVKWHIIKDVPNTSFRHIILENNENKPVTNSRDTQEIMYAKGKIMLEVFKDSPLKTSILDDFMFYEERQKIMYEEKSKYSSASRSVYIPAVVCTIDSNSKDSTKQNDSVDHIGKIEGQPEESLKQQSLRTTEENISSNGGNEEGAVATSIAKMKSLSISCGEKVTIGSIPIEISSGVAAPIEFQAMKIEVKKKAAK